MTEKELKKKTVERKPIKIGRKTRKMNRERKWNRKRNLNGSSKETITEENPKQPLHMQNLVWAKPN